LINKTLANCVQDARKFNSREGLFEKEITDYSKVQQLIKDFQPYSHLWLITSKWAERSEKWMHDEWETLDAEECERFVEESIKNLQVAIRYFTEKDILPILRIAKEVRTEIDDFKKKVPLMVALRKKGMTDRHWNEVSQKINIRV
jgi:dynein heavy chain